MVSPQVNPELPQELGEVLRHLEACYPNEGCGLILRGPRGWTVRPMANVYDRYHAKDPERFPRTSRTAYLFDPKEWLAVSEQADREGVQVVCVFHSHADVGAYFSQEDREMAAPDGEAVLPGVSYLVVAVDGGKASAAKLFWWADNNFHEAPVSLPSR
ncbi:MAG TPA: M67 family metallopeptidase [Myxococcaceae bacterium]|nr:M67 family metallopeptidase [Myxococcaceae bacterium]